MRESTTLQIERWIHLLRQGDETARSKLIECACQRLEHLTRQMLRRYPGVKRWEQTADVAQNALVRLHKALLAVTPATGLDFFRLAAVQIRRELIDLARHYFGPLGMGTNEDGRRPEGEHSSFLADTPDAAHDPVELALWTEVHTLIEGFPEEERNLWDLLWYQELSQEEAAQILHVSQATIARRWRSTRLRLQSLLQTNGQGLDR